MPDNKLPQAELFIATGCAHCPAVMESLSQQLKQGHLASLHIHNIASATEAAEKQQVRSVPWIRIGELISPAAATPGELAQMIKWATQGEAGLRAYYSQLLAEGQLAQAENMLSRYPHHLEKLLPLLAIEDTPIQVRLGMDVLLESLEGSALLVSQIPRLEELAGHALVNVRVDALHYLALTHHNDAIAAISRAMEDPHPQVQEAAEEAMEDLSATQS